MRLIHKIIILSFMMVSVGKYRALAEPTTSPFYGTISKKTLDKLNSNVIKISPDFFNDRSVLISTINDIERYLNSMDAKSRAYGSPKVLQISIVSGGGSVSLYRYFDRVIGGRFKKAHVICNVGFAMSMAFTFMINYCDERILEVDSSVGQHQVYMSLFGIVIRNDNSRRISRELSDIEAEVLGLDYDYWYYISREHGDKYFDNIEVKEFGIKTN